MYTSANTCRSQFDVSLTVHHSIEIFSSTNFNAQFFINNMLLHYYPRHVSGINMPIYRGKDCIHTASGIFALCKRLHSTQVDSQCTVQTFTESEDTRCCVYTIFPPEDGHINHLTPNGHFSGRTAPLT
jgi:hypothetical protein